MTPLTLTERSFIAATKLPFIGRFIDKKMERRGFYDNDEFEAAYGPDAVRKMVDEQDVGLHPETGYLTALIGSAYDALNSAQGVAHELERDRVLEADMIDTSSALVEIAILLERLGKFNASPN